VQTALSRIERESPYEPLPLWAKVAIPGLAGWLGWGIRGQMGHETGAMVPGGMIGLSLAFTSDDLELRRRTGLMGAVGAMSISFGGTETYGQTLGLSMGDTREETYWWGLLGTTVKGGAWFGLGGTYLGMAAGDVPYSPIELLALAGVESALWHLGIELLNRPHEPPDRLPAIYFSDSHHLDDPDRQPRQEYWGGQWLALLGLLAYAAAKGDLSALIMGLMGVLGGAAGFTGGQAIQAWARSANLPEKVNRSVDYWKVMETTFGAVGGATLGFGMHLARLGQPPLPPRKRFSFWERALAAAVGAFALIEDLAEKPWTEDAMDSMQIAGAGIAAAFSCDEAAWLEALPLVNAYMVQNTVDYFRDERKMREVAATVDQASLPVSSTLGLLGLALSRLEAGGGRGPAGVGLLAMAWAHTNLSHVKMLSTEETLGLDDPDRRPLPALKMVEQVVRRNARSAGLSQLVTETAFTVAALGLTALVLWAFTKRK
jgi:hypothetical protein